MTTSNPYAGVGGSYVYDPATGTTVPAQPEPAQPGAALPAAETLGLNEAEPTSPDPANTAPVGGRRRATPTAP